MRTLTKCQFATDPQMRVLNKILKDDKVHYTWIHHTTRLSLLDKGYVTEDKDGYLHLTKMSKYCIG